ncbi:2-(R)-hydroxypropyl-CoM dehydrogenase [Pseudocercospora fuligena]|uniref:2-(R)-hydroxypropyl-CoM dehydrogenase n=1 Tax=Pseudocercospora fuligena TaxID=685502 RepID=A0A8H6VGN6_9PEZI|nr:2-(R)-hydroxypropyl-CoM dehydrogenase [Pseudocercospora fuligena]
MANGKRIPNRIALVTGASSGLGRAMCLQLAAEGAKICAVDLYEYPRNKTNLQTGKADDYKNRLENEETVIQELRRLHGEEVTFFVKADITKSEEIENAVNQCVERFGRLDIMCNNAGISVESTHPSPLPIHQLPELDWDTTMSINAKGVFLGCKFSITQMLQQPQLYDSRGWIINTASIQGLVAYYNTPAYTASKGAVVQLTKQVALDYAKYKIHCNAICPGFLRTAMTQNLQNDPVMQAEIDKAHPLGGMGRPEDVAKAVLFLASDDVAWITGVNLPVDGGYMIM